MKQQLLISYSFPPLANAESITTAKMVFGLEKQNWKTIVCTVKENSDPGSKDPSLMELLPKTVEIARSHSLPFKKILALLRKLGLKEIALLASSLPDDRILWFPTALLNIKKALKKNHCKLIHSRSFPITNHLLGYFAKMDTGLPWLAHFSDPWIDSPYYTNHHPYIKRLHSAIEGKIINNADIVTFTSNAACDLVMEKYPIKWLKKCYIIPHGYETVSEKPIDKKFLPQNCLNIVYIGSFYGVRTPQPLLAALKTYAEEGGLRSKVNIWLIGRMPHQEYSAIIKSYGIEKIIHVVEPVPYKIAMKYAKEADVLLNIETNCKNSDIFLESKLVEYIGFSKPIWGIGSPCGAGARLLNSLKFPFSDINNLQNILDTLKLIYRRWETHVKIAPVSAEHKIQEYYLTNTSQKLASILSSICK